MMVRVTALVKPRLRRCIACCILALQALAYCLYSAPTAAAEPMRYIRPQPESHEDRRMDFYWELLAAALEATSDEWGPYEMGVHPLQMNAERAAHQLASGQAISVMARTTSRSREQQLRPVRIPLDKGLTGYRLFLINAPLQTRLDSVLTLDDLKALRIGQGALWVDNEILRAAGLRVEEGANYESLFLMLGAGRFELLSRGINEIGRELEDGRARNPQLAIEKRLMLYYPLPRYFFFARSAQGERLAQRAEVGLRLLIRNGEFERRYQRFKARILAGLDLSGRILFRLPNPTLPAETPLEHKALWDSLERELKAAR